MGEKAIVVTGGAGFIGSALIKELNQQGYEKLIVVDELGHDEKWKNLLGKRFLQFIDKEKLFDWLKGREDEIQAFFHLGACSSTTEKNGNFLLENNTNYSIRLAEYALKAGHRFIYASSAATYGNGERGFSDQHEKLEELLPLNLYGFSKHLFDLWLFRQNLLDKVVGLKYFNVFGPNEYHKGAMTSAIVKMTHDRKTKGFISLFASSEPEKYADGEQIRDFIYVKDVMKMTVQFLTNTCHGIYNIGSGQPSSWNQLAKSVCNALHLSDHIEYIPMPKELLGKYQNYTVADMSKSIQGKLLMPSFTLENGVGDYVRNYLTLGHYV